jgi:hypothetical protein
MLVILVSRRRKVTTPLFETHFTTGARMLWPNGSNGDPISAKPAFYQYFSYKNLRVRTYLLLRIVVPLVGHLGYARNLKKLQQRALATGISTSKSADFSLLAATAKSCVAQVSRVSTHRGATFRSQRGQGSRMYLIH